MILTLRAETGVVSVEDLPRLVEQVSHLLPKLGEQVVILSGRMPVWVFATCVHSLHPTRGVATFDPRLNAGVVVARHHDTCPEVGALIPLEGDEIVVTI